MRVRGSKSPLIDPKKKKELSRSVLGTSSANQIVTLPQLGGGRASSPKDNNERIEMFLNDLSQVSECKDPKLV